MKWPSCSSWSAETLIGHLVWLHSYIFPVSSGGAKTAKTQVAQNV